MNIFVQCGFAITLLVSASSACLCQQVDSIFGGLSYGMTAQEVIRFVKTLGQRPEVTDYEDKICEVRYTAIVWNEYADVSAHLCSSSPRLAVVVIFSDCQELHVSPTDGATATSDCILAAKKIKKLLTKKYGKPTNSTIEFTKIRQQVWKSHTSQISIITSWPIMVGFEQLTEK